jgi:hypothetical protein
MYPDMEAKLLDYHIHHNSGGHHSSRSQVRRYTEDDSRVGEKTEYAILAAR